MNKFFLKKNMKSNAGFTLVEMMVAVAVFSVVMTVAAGALLSVIDANKKAQAIQTAINNVNFALESISKDMRMGTDYGCIDSSWNSLACNSISGNVGVTYKSSKNQTVSYLFDSVNGKIQRKIGSDSPDDLTAAEAKITDMNFYVLGINNSLKQPRVIITLNGQAGKTSIQTNFSLQTTVSRRIRN